MAKIDTTSGNSQNQSLNIQQSLRSACDALSRQAPNWTAVIELVEHARAQCGDCFPDGMVKQLYLGIRWEHSALELFHKHEWGRSLSSVSRASDAYKLARQRGRGTWVVEAAERGLQRCMEIGVQTLGAENQELKPEAEEEQAQMWHPGRL